MVGITSYGAYIPWHRLDRQLFVKAWGGFAIPGERSVAYYDEDSVTMAVEAAMDCVNGLDPRSVDGLFFSTTTSPYREKQCSTIIAMAVAMRRDGRTADFNTSLRAGTTAFGLALDSIKAGTVNSVMVTSADTRLAAPGGMMEQQFGDGAAAFLLGKDDVIAEILESHTISDELAPVWRGDNDVFMRSWDDRMVQDVGYSRYVPETISALMKKCGLEPKDFSKLVFDPPGDPRGHMKAAAQLGFEASQIEDPYKFFLSTGNTGCAMAPMMLASALEEAKPGDKIIFAGTGNGCDAFVLQVTDAIEKLEERRGIKHHLGTKKMMPNYNSYLRWRNIVPFEEARRIARTPIRYSAIWRERKALLGLWGIKCKQCGTPQYDNGAMVTTPIRYCAECHAQDDFEDYRFAEKKAKIFSFTHDSLAASVDPPNSIVLIDFDDGGRAFFDLTDREADETKIGAQVEMAFRKVYVDQGFTNYFWKARPIR